MSTEKDCLVLANREEGWQEKSRASRNNLTEVWRVSGLPWDDEAGKSSPRARLGLLGFSLSLSHYMFKKWLEPLTKSKGKSTNLHFAMKMPHLHLTRDSPTQRSTWVGQICPCGLGAFECLPRGSNKISIKILNKHMDGEARGIEMPMGAELRGKTSEQTRGY